MLDAGESASPDQIAQTLQNYSRTPSDTIELFWKPGAADFEFNDPSATAVATLRDRKQSLTVVFAGLPGSVGITCHFTAIYEWQPALGQGIGNNALGKNPSRNTFDEVVDTLTSAGFRFVSHTAQAVGGGVARAVVDTVSRAFGNMPARPYARSALTWH
jgi:hypothetical protein